MLLLGPHATLDANIRLRLGFSGTFPVSGLQETSGSMSSSTIQAVGLEPAASMLASPVQLHACTELKHRLSAEQSVAFN